MFIFFLFCGMTLFFLTGYTVWTIIAAKIGTGKSVREIVRRYL